MKKFFSNLFKGILAIFSIILGIVTGISALAIGVVSLIIMGIASAIKWVFIIAVLGTLALLAGLTGLFLIGSFSDGINNIPDNMNPFQKRNHRFN